VIAGRAGSEPIDLQEVSAAIGYEDVAFFRALFQRHTGTSPREYRARFGVRRAVA